MRPSGGSALAKSADAEASGCPAHWLLGTCPTNVPTAGMGHFVVDAHANPWFAGATTPRQAGNRSYGKRRGARRAMNAQQLLQEISDYCRLTGLAESTFRRGAVHDGKLQSRLRHRGAP